MDSESRLLLDTITKDWKQFNIDNLKDFDINYVEDMLETFNSIKKSICHNKINKKLL